MGDGAGPLHDALALLGATPQEVDEAERTGTLLALAAERFLLPGGHHLDANDLATLSGADPDELVKLFLALGFSQPTDEKVFTDYDVEIIKTFLRDGTDEMSEYTLHEARVISAAIGRVAEVIVDEIWDQHLAAGQTEREALAEIAPTLDFNRVERMLLYLVRRQIVTALYRRSALRWHARRHGSASLAVGFADVANFSVLSQHMTDNELTELVVGFEKVAYDVAAELGGRVVKTLGDGVMYSSDDPVVAATIGLRLSSLGQEPPLPPVRVGIALGPVLVREGDCFGPTVNLVSRVVNCAGAGEVVIDRAMADALATVDAWTIRPLGNRPLKSFGEVELWMLEPLSHATT